MLLYKKTKELKFMKKLIFILVLLLSAVSFASEDSIVGLWITEKGDSGNQLIVEIYKNKDKYNGRIKNTCRQN